MNEILIERAREVSPEYMRAFELLMPQLTTASPPEAADLQKLLDSASILVFARLSDGGPITGAGTLGVFRTPSGLHAHIEDVVVDEAARGLGIGEAIVLHLLQTAREIGLKGVSLTCSPRRSAANRLYQKLGFKKWDTNVYWLDL